MAKRWDLDRLGAWASGICAVHCLATGVALSALAVVGLDWMGSLAAEATFLTTAVLIGSFAAIRGYRRHRSWRPFGLLALGLAMLAVSHFVLGHDHHAHAAGAPHAHDHGGSLVTTLLAVGGGLCLVGFHFLNARLGRVCGHRPLASSGGTGVVSA